MERLQVPMLLPTSKASPLCTSLSAPGLTLGLGALAEGKMSSEQGHGRGRFAADFKHVGPPGAAVGSGVPEGGTASAKAWRCGGPRSWALLWRVEAGCHVEGLGLCFGKPYGMGMVCGQRSDLRCLCSGDEVLRPWGRWTG